MISRIFLSRILLIVMLVAGCTSAPHAPREPHSVFTATRSPALPPAWSQPVWYVDPANSTGCASDNNTCSSATCGDAGNIGPCLSWGEVIERWGTTTPRWRTSVALHQLSTDSNLTDVLYLDGSIETGGPVTLDCPPITVCSGTLSGVVARDYATQQRLTATLCAGASINNLIVNTTHPSRAWVDSLVSGNSWVISNPTTSISIPWNGGDQNEVNSWANGDSYTVSSLCQTRIGSIRPISGTYIASTIPGVYITNIDVLPPAGAGQGGLPVAAGAIYLNESVIDAYLLVDSQALSNEPTVFNSVANYSVSTSGNGSITNEFGWKGGILRQQVFASTASMYIENGTYVEGAGITILNGIMRDVYVGAGAYIQMLGRAGVTNYGFGGGGQGVWGPGQFELSAPGNVAVASGAADFANVTTMTLNWLPTACAMAADGGAPQCGRTLNASNLDLSIADGGFGGFAWSPAGATITTATSPF